MKVDLDEDEVPQTKGGPKELRLEARSKRPEDGSKSPVLYREVEQENARKESLRERQGTHTRIYSLGRRQRSSDAPSDRKKAELKPRGSRRCGHASAVSSLAS